MNTIEQLTAFLQKDKFSTQVWNERGLNPSSDEICAALSIHFNETTNKLIEAVHNNKSERQIKSLLTAQLSKLSKSDFDTEERGFICDLFHELASIFSIDFNETLSKWMYGSFLTTLMRIQKTVRPTRVVETLYHPCTGCEVQLETYILGKENGIPDNSWFIVRCSACKELNLLSSEPNVKELRFGNYEWVETLRKDEFTQEQAMVRLEQIKYFRK